MSYTGTKGGMETYARELYKRLGTIVPSWEFIGFMSREGFQLDRSWFPGETIDSGISGENRFAWAYGELFAVARAARRVGADLVHSPATLGPRNTRMPSVVSMHDVLYFSHPEYMSTPLYTGPVRWMERMTSRNATRVMTISEVSRQEILRYLKVPEDRIDLVPLAGTPLPGVDRSLASSDGPLVIATGNRRPHKNWDALIRALPLIPEDERPRVVITGGRGDDPLAAVVAETGMQNWVELRGWVDEEEMRDCSRRRPFLQCLRSPRGRLCLRSRR